MHSLPYAGLLPAVALCTALIVTPAQAQVTIGGSAQPSVEVNLDAIYGGGGGTRRSSNPLAGPGARDYDPLETPERRYLLIPNLKHPRSDAAIGLAAPKLTPPAGVVAAQPNAPALRRPPAEPAPARPMMKDEGKSMAARQPVMPAPSPPPLRAEPRMAKPETPAPKREETAAVEAPRGQLPAGMVPPPPKPMSAQPSEARQVTPSLPSTPPRVAARPGAPPASISAPDPVKVPPAMTATDEKAKPAAPAPSVLAPVQPMQKSEPMPMAEPERRVASLPPADSGTLRIPFGTGSAAIATDDEGRLKAFADSLQDNEKRVQLRAFAAEQGDSASRARRLSLSRALAVRSYLIENGVRSTRIDVRALGASGDGGPDDRVDVIVLER